MKKEMMIFENHEVEIFELDGKVLFNPRNVAECLDIEFKTAQNHMAIMPESQVIKLTNESISHLTGFRKLNNAGENFLTESGVYKLIFKSRKPEAEKFQDWVTDTVLPSIRKTGSFSTSKEKELTHFEKELIAVECVARMLNMSDVSKLGMMQKLFEVKGFDKNVLPAYVEKKRISFSATKLLEDRGKPMSALAFNKMLIADGFLEEKERKGSAGSVKKFKALTTKGLQYGENLVSPKNDREVQPMYYEDSFDELLQIINSEPESE